MTEEMKLQLAELTGIHEGLSNLAELDHETVLSGTLPFEASADGLETITDIRSFAFSAESRISQLLVRGGRQPLVEARGSGMSIDY